MMSTFSIDEIRTQRPVRLLRFALRGQRPDHLLLAEILRDAHAEHEAVAPRLETRRLPLIGAARLNVVVGTDRNVGSSSQLSFM